MTHTLLECGPHLSPQGNFEIALENNHTAAAIWEEMRPLSVAELSTDPDKRDAFYEVVEVTPLMIVPNEALPDDLKDTAYIPIVKNEGKQKGRAYKIRGNTNALLSADVLPKSVHRASTGNHGNTGVLADAELGVEESYVHCPADTQPPKLIAIESNGGSARPFYLSLGDAVVAAKKAGAEPGAMFIHPYDMKEVLAGQGTIGCEIAAQLEALGLANVPKTVVLPGGGGGIGASNGVSTKAYDPSAVVLISQMEGADGIVKALAGKQLDPEKLVKACDGAAVATPGELPMAIIADGNFIDGVGTVTMAEIGEAMAVLANMHEVPEPAGALSMALALKQMRSRPLSNETGDAAELMVTVTSGLMVTPQKVRDFLAEAWRLGLVSGQRAEEVVAQAQTEQQSVPRVNSADYEVTNAAHETNDEPAVLDEVTEPQNTWTTSVSRGHTVASHAYAITEDEAMRRRVQANWHEILADCGIELVSR